MLSSKLTHTTHETGQTLALLVFVLIFFFSRDACFYFVESPLLPSEIQKDY